MHACASYEVHEKKHILKSALHPPDDRIGRTSAASAATVLTGTRSGCGNPNSLIGLHERKISTEVARACVRACARVCVCACVCMMGKRFSHRSSASDS